MFTKFFALCALVAFANAATILLPETKINNVAVAKTSINGPSGSITKEESVPIITHETKALIDTPVAIEAKTVVHPDSVVVEAVHHEVPVVEAKTLIHHEVPVVEAKTLIHHEVPVVEAKTLVHHEVPVVEARTFVHHQVPVVHHEVPVVATKSIVHEVPVHHEIPLVQKHLVSTPVVHEPYLVKSAIPSYSYLDGSYYPYFYNDLYNTVRYI